MSLNWNPEIIQTCLTAVVSLVVWAVKRTHSRLDEHAKRVNDIELTLARDYVKHDDLADLKREQRRNGRMLAHIQLQLVALAARLSVRVEPFNHEGDDEVTSATV